LALAQEVQEKEKPKELSKEEKQLMKAQRALWLAHVLRDRTGQNIIKDLKISKDKIPVFLIPQDDSFRPLVKLEVEFNRPGWNLFIGDKLPMRRQKDGSYVLYAYLRSRLNAVEIRAQNEQGAQEREILYLFAPEAREFKLVSPFDSVLFTLGHSFLVYEQTSFGTFVAQSLMLGVRYVSPDKGNSFGLLGDFTATVFTYDSSPIEQNPQFMEGRLGLTYPVKLIKNPKYRTKLFLGASTINFVSYGSPFGFSGLYSADLGIRTVYYRSGQNSYAGEFHYAPIEFSDPLGERSFRFVFDWSMNLDNLRQAQIGLSYSNHSFKVGFEDIYVEALSVFGSISF
jgi:hypothetical protein